jgi:hypothetical protein
MVKKSCKMPLVKQNLRLFWQSVPNWNKNLQEGCGRARTGTDKAEMARR